MPTHIERRHLPYTVHQMFDLVADVESYPAFIDQFAALRIRRRDDNVLHVAQVVRLGLLSVEFASTAVLDRPRQITITSADARFERFEHRWRFSPASPHGTDVEFASTVELRAGALQRLMRAVFDERQAAQSTILAFKRRARQIFGVPAAATPALA
jgi:coenzyme Q-binding protein COQ10